MLLACHLAQEPDEPHIAAGREAVRALRGLPGLLGLQNPLLI